MIRFDKLLDKIMQLNFSERELLLETLKRQQIEERRKKYFRKFKRAKRDLLFGKIKPMSAVKTILQLSQSINESKF